MSADTQPAGMRTRRRVSVRGLRWRGSYNRHLLTVAIVIAASFAMWRQLDPPERLIIRSAPVVVPDPGAQDLARQYAQAFLSFDASDPQRRADHLQALTMSGDVAAEVFRPGTGSRTITDTSIVQATRHTGGGIRYVVAASSHGGPRIYLAVTVGRDTDGRLAVVGAPAIVGGPILAKAAQGGVGRQVGDPAVLAVTERALGNYLAGSTDNLAADVATDAVISVPDIPVRLVRVLAQQTEPGARSAVVVTALVQGPDGEQLQLAYELLLAQEGGRWVVGAINDDPTGP